MNVYDFDKTIYKSDCSRDFLLWLLRKKPSLCRFLPSAALAAIKYKCGIWTKTQMKEVVFSMISALDDVAPYVELFWQLNRHRIADYYMAQRRSDDVIISASPEFLLRGICAQLEVGTLIASPCHPKTGRFTGENCYGAEKVVRFRAIFPDATVHEFYSDSLSDTPMAKIAEKSYLVCGEAVNNWPQ